MGAHKFNKMRMYHPTELYFNARTVAAANTVSNVFGTGGYSQLSFVMSVTHVNASAWTVFFEWSPNYNTSSTVIWAQTQMVTPSAGTSTLADNTYSFTTNTNDTLSIDMPINYPNMRFTVSNTAGTTDTATAYIVLGAV